MTITYLPFDAGAGAGIASETQWEQLHDPLQLDGVVAGYPAAVTPGTTELQVYGDSTGMQCKVRAGAGWLKGRSYYSDAEQTFAVTGSDPTNPRWDLVVLRIDRSANTIAVAVLAGSPGVSPAETALTQNATTHEIPLARVVVAAGVTTIAAAAVIDRRQFAIPNSKGLPLCRLWRNANQTIATSTVSAVDFTHALLDTGQFWVVATPSRLICKRAGIYRFHANGRFAANATGLRQYVIRKNGTTTIGADWAAGTAVTELVKSVDSGPVAMAAGDYVEFCVYQSSGGNLNLEAQDDYSPILTAELVRALQW